MTDSQIIEVIRTRRRELGITQQQLGDILGVKRQYISMVEQQKKVPTIATLVRLCDALGLDVNIIPKDGTA